MWLVITIRVLYFWIAMLKFVYDKLLKFKTHQVSFLLMSWNPDGTDSDSALFELLLRFRVKPLPMAGLGTCAESIFAGKETEK